MKFEDIRQKFLVEELQELCTKVIAERDALAAKLAQMEAQEPCGVVTGRLGTIASFHSTSARKGDKLFLAPGANPDAKDAERYRWLRAQNWTKGGLVVTHIKNVGLGSMCPSDTMLDQTIDEVIGAKNV